MLWEVDCSKQWLCSPDHYKPGLRSMSKTFANVSLKIHFRRTFANVLPWHRNAFQQTRQVACSSNIRICWRWKSASIRLFLYWLNLSSYRWGIWIAIQPEFQVSCQRTGQRHNRETPTQSTYPQVQRHPATRLWAVESCLNGTRCERTQNKYKSGYINSDHKKYIMLSFSS